MTAQATAWMTVRLDRRPDQYRRGEAPLFRGDARWEPSRSSAFLTMCTELRACRALEPARVVPWGAAHGILEVSDKLFLLGIGRDRGFAGRLERLHFSVDVLELGVAVGVACAFARLAVGLLAEAQAIQQATHQLLAGGEALLRQRRR
jgi:hypothetical protein